MEASAKLLQKLGALDLRQIQYDEYGFNIGSWPAPFDLFWGGHVSVERQPVINEGKFDEGFVSWGGEDIDLGIRLYLANNQFIASPKLFSIDWPHPRDTIDYAAHAERASVRLHEKYNLWKTAPYRCELNKENHYLNKAIHL